MATPIQNNAARSAGRTTTLDQQPATNAATSTNEVNQLGSLAGSQFEGGSATTADAPLGIATQQNDQLGGVMQYLMQFVRMFMSLMRLFGGMTGGQTGPGPINTVGGTNGIAGGGLPNLNGGGAVDTGHLTRGADLPYLNQMHQPLGSVACGPTSAAMIARARSQRDPNATITGADGRQYRIADLSDQQLVSVLEQVGHTHAPGQTGPNDPGGTSPNGILAMAQALTGHQLTDADVFFGGKKYNPANPNDPDVGQRAQLSGSWLEQKLGEGKAVILNGGVPINGGYSGHYVTVTAQQGDLFEVEDPYFGKQWKTLSQLQEFAQDNPSLYGAAYAVPLNG